MIGYVTDVFESVPAAALPATVARKVQTPIG